MSVGASQKYDWSRVIRIKESVADDKDKYNQPEVWLGKAESKESVAANQKCGG